MSLWPHLLAHPLESFLRNLTLETDESVQAIRIFLQTKPIYTVD